MKGRAERGKSSLVPLQKGHGESHRTFAVAGDALLCMEEMFPSNVPLQAARLLGLCLGTGELGVGQPHLFP